MDEIILKKYYELGVLSIKEGKWKAIDRLRGGEMLYKDFCSAGFNIPAIDQRIPRVDYQRMTQFSEKRLQAEDRFRKGIAAVPREFFNVVNKVCIENTRINTKQSREDVYAEKLDLCRGLDYLCDFYTTPRTKREHVSLGELSLIAGLDNNKNLKWHKKKG